MSLGYVVNCDVRKVGESQGLRIVVQSQYPLSVVYSSVETAISTIDDFLSTMSDETFEQQRSAMYKHYKTFFPSSLTAG
jgi:secreted Zn-dependent insulinase-like peptidase